MDGDRLRAAHHALDLLPGRFPKVLPAIVGDVREWSAAVSARLSLLGDILNRRKPLPQGASLFTELPVPGVKIPVDLLAACQGREGEQFLSALWWAFAHPASGLRAILKPLAAAPDRLRTLLAAPRALGGIHPPLRLCELLVEDPRRSQPLLEALADDRLYRIRLSPPGERDLARRGDEHPSPSPGIQLWTLVDRLEAMDAAGRKRALVLFGMVGPRRIVAAWERYWVGARPELDALARAVKEMRRNDVDGYEIADFCRSGIDRIREGVPGEYDLPATLADLVQESAGDSRFRNLTAALGLLPETVNRVPVRAGALRLWAETCRSVPDAAVNRLLAGFRAYASSRPRDLRALWPWSQALRGKLHTTPESLASCGDLPFPLIDDFLASLDLASRSGLRIAQGEISTVLKVLARLINAHRAPGPAAASLESLHRADSLEDAWYIGPDLLSLASLISTPEGIAAPVARLRKMNYDEDWGLSRALLDFARREERRPVIAGLIAHGDLRLLVECAHLAMALEGVGGSRDLEHALKASSAREADCPTTGPPSWVTAYPRDLHSCLHGLAAVDPAAERQARRMLGPIAGTDRRSLREIESIRGRIATAPSRDRPGLARRLAALEGAVAAAGGSAPRHLDRAVRAIERRTFRMTAAGWLARLDHSLQERLRAFMAIGDEPAAEDLSTSWIRDRRVLALLANLHLLPPGFRNLARRVLRARCGPRPWDLRDAPQNSAFLARISRLRPGFRREVWLDGIGETRRMVGGAEVRIALEDDPIEIMLMGAPFATCLAPGRANFHAAVANAVDVNKRVIFARTGTGAVAARCLVALSNAGNLLAYHVYCHRRSDALKTAVADYARQFAAAAGTPPTPRGTVECLVAPEWYDDGARDITARLKALDAQEFKDRLETLPAGELVAYLGGTLAAPLDPATAGHLLEREFETFARRAELVGPLLPLIEDYPDLDPRIALHTASLARRAGHLRPAQRMLARLCDQARSHAAVSRLGLDGWLFHQEVAELLGAEELLRLLRRTREPGIRSWGEETDGERLLAAARAHEALHRPSMALSLLLLANRRGVRRESGDEIARGIRRLRKLLGR